MEHYASEDEQVEQIKRWWKENGKSLVFGLVIGVGGLAGYRYWDGAETARAENASINYEVMLSMASERRFDDARKTGQAIIDSDPESTYARLSALVMAKLSVDEGDYAAARDLLTPLATQPPSSEIAQVARARLARLELAEGQSAAAAKLLAEIPGDDTGARFAELRADVHAANGDVSSARALYLEALAQAESLGLERGAIQLKLDNLAASADSDS